VHCHPKVLAGLQPQTSPFWPRLPDNWPPEPSRRAVRHSDSLALALALPIQLVFLPTYAPWLNPIEKLLKSSGVGCVRTLTFCTCIACLMTGNVSHCACLTSWPSLLSAHQPYFAMSAFYRIKLLRYISRLEERGRNAASPLREPQIIIQIWYSISRKNAFEPFELA
jgi:hypothetical protein